jgi:hypothetical protein
VCSPRRGDEGGSRISPAAADGGLQPKLHGRRSGGPPAVGRGSLDAAPRRASPGEDGVARQCSVVAAQVSRKLVHIELAMVTINTIDRERGRKVGIRWGRPPNVDGNDKMERDRQGECDGVLTFGQR